VGEATAVKRRVRKPRILKATGILRYGGRYAASSGYDRFQYVVVTREAAHSAARLPGVALVYTSGATLKRDWSTGVSYAEASANGWLLRDASGSIVRGAQATMVADVGNAGYQHAFVTDAQRLIRTTGVRGVFIDVVLADLRTATSGVVPAKYPTPEAWEAAMVSFVAHVGDALRANGYYVVVNAAKFVRGDPRSNDGTFAREFAAELAPHVSGVAVEYWLQAPSDLSLRGMGSTWRDHWDGWENLMQAVQGEGADFFGIMYGSSHDVQAMRFGRGTFLLDWDGKGGAFIFSLIDQSDPYEPAWVTQLGVPDGNKFPRAGGVWQRRYTHGIVLVNPTKQPSTVLVQGVPRTVAATDTMFLRLRR
jgi:Hypothetical glycosyl hydrolase family 15